MSRRIGLVLLLSALAPAAFAQSRDDSRIDGHAAADVSGVASLNVAAGVGNAQSNLRAIAVGDTALAQAFGAQSVDTTGADLARDARAAISGSALDNANGVVGLNQVAGHANAQANLIAIGTAAGVTFAQSVDESALAATAAPASTTTSSSTPVGTREARIDAGAIAAPTGVLQINQTAGVGNASANAIVLQLPGGTP
ncbi:hypothetical protein DWG18_13425 [Lysobacter sp. TY2-98]|uniref:hypothetical protein n=1 Tax=Lysobacter sp. TY2-98 TaxID=2290922 RepID=UPI000E1FDD5A|nr:hypothetical protein [Lysobacter sp. TY2-98]AXK73185.1 hypothetical protein DWG18_13425 [Lysobacter sp. TY2-98]